MTTVLIVLNVLATAMIFTATITPGWLCLDNYLDDTKMSGVALDMNAFYSRVCGYDSDTCSVVPFLDYRSNSRLSSVAIEGRFTEYLVESILTILCTTIGCFLTVVYLLRRRNLDNVHDLRQTTSKLTNAALFLSIVGGVFGSILAIEFIQLNWKYDSIINTNNNLPTRCCSFSFENEDDSLEQTDNYLEKRFPYSLVIISGGLLLQAISIIRHINLRKAPNMGTILIEPVNTEENMGTMLIEPVNTEENEPLVSSTP
ncbi:unnamed protein product [Mytilus edulis]|uniref:Uncharacterized protein n=1 Tax=Mytilus edulis TaxID=6550 RepID=A0A8S3Q436_MYTED|nr:unnamed protein product [Mytilus edulis]